jgi:hypothetical protein
VVAGYNCCGGGGPRRFLLTYLVFTCLGVGVGIDGMLLLSCLDCCRHMQHPKHETITCISRDNNPIVHVSPLPIPTCSHAVKAQKRTVAMSIIPRIFYLGSLMYFSVVLTRAASCACTACRRLRTSPPSDHCPPNGTRGSSIPPNRPVLWRAPCLC